MRRIKSLVVTTTLLMAALLLACIAAEAALAHPSTIPDVPESHPAHDAIELLAARGIVGGTASGLFLPDDALTRGQAAKMLVNWRVPQAPGTPETIFPDVEGTFAPFVTSASAVGWMKGYPDGTFRPDLSLTREQMAAVVVRSLGLEAKARGLTEGEIDSVLHRFADEGSVTVSSRPSVALVVGYGLFTGNAGRLNPWDPMTRAQFSLVLARADELAERIAAGMAPAFLADDADPPVVSGAGTRPGPDGAAETPIDTGSGADDTGSSYTGEQLALAAFMDEALFKPHRSAVTGEMVLQNAEWYGIPPLSQLVIMAAETSLGDPQLGGTLARRNNFGCLRYHGADTPWGVLSDGCIWVAGNDWYSFPTADVGMAAFGRYLKVGAGGFYLPLLTSSNPDWERFAAVYYGSGVSGFSNYVSRLYSLERSFRASAARYGVSF